MNVANNRFDLVRLLLAFAVFLYHAVALSAAAPNGQLEFILGEVAELSIQGFFIVSGLLVFGSLERSKTLADYAGKRVRRLYPAYAVIVLIPVIFSAVLSFGQTGAAGEILRYIGANLAFLNFLEPSLPGLFQEQRFSDVNGALWTLKIEVMFYLALPILAWGLTKLKTYWWMGIALIVFAAFVWKQAALAMEIPESAQLSRQLPGQMMYFAAGMALWRLWPLLASRACLAFAIGAVTLAAALLVPALDAVRVLGLAGLIAGVAFMPGPPLAAARWGDISYGVYIVHFPIVQGLVMVGAFAILGLAGGILLSTILVFAASYLLWWWVEKPALRKDSHYRKISEEGTRDERIRNDHAGRDASWNSDPHAKSP